MATPPNRHRGHSAAPNIIGPNEGIPAPAPKGYGAIAFSRSTRRYGWSHHAADRSAAERIALQHCQASDAAIVAWGQSAYLALALADDGAYGWAWDPARDNAAQRAIANCAGPNPRIVVLYHTLHG